MEYEFFSVGPKGRIKKVVRFIKVSTNVGDIYNLGFGDWDERTRSMNDSVTSNNGDTDKVLITVAHIAIDFTERFLNAEILAIGTPGRIRLYRMKITHQLVPIYTFFSISGLTKDNVIEPFVKDKDYIAFIAKRRLFKRNPHVNS
jgi:hypothetical protein